MSTLLNLGRDVGGQNTYSPSFSTDGKSTTLAQNVAQTFTVPSNFSKWNAIFSIDPGLRVFVANNVAATLPGASFASNVSQLNPVARQVNAGDVLSFITPDVAAYVTVSLYALS